MNESEVIVRECVKEPRILQDLDDGGLEDKSKGLEGVQRALPHGEPCGLVAN